MRKFLLVGLLALSACGTALPPPPKTYRQALVEAAVSYTAAAHAATVYAEQPRCGTAHAPPAPLCADRVVVVALGKASQAARAALRIAQSLDGIAAPDAQNRALTSVQTALTELAALTPAAEGH